MPGSSGLVQKLGINNAMSLPTLRVQAGTLVQSITSRQTVAHKQQSGVTLTVTLLFSKVCSIGILGTGSAVSPTAPIKWCFVALTFRSFSNRLDLNVRQRRQ